MTATNTDQAQATTGPVVATAATLDEVGAPLVVREVEIDQPRENELLVKISGVGICHTDVAAIEGNIPLPLPAVLGHEGSGVVAAVGPGVTEFAVGDRVAISYDHCRECDVCKEGHPSYCDLFAPLNYFGERMDGSTTLHAGEEEVHGNFFGQSTFASHAICSVNNAVKVPDDLPLELLGPLGCGFQTGAGSVINVLKAEAGKGIIIFGLGAVGMGAVMAAASVGCDPIIGVDLNPKRLETAVELGATATINPAETDDLLWRVQELAAPGLHYSFDAVGLGPVVRQALESLRTHGHCVTVGFQGLEHEITIDQGHLLLGRRLSGVIEGDADPKEFIPQMIELHRAGKFPFDKLITTFPFAQINEALEAAHRGDVIKPVLVFD